MPRFVFALVVFACVSHGAAIIGVGALAAGTELSRCVDAATILGAGGDVSHQELQAAQSACARLKQSPPDRDTLARVKAAAETIEEEVKRRAASSR